MREKQLVIYEHQNKVAWDRNDAIKIKDREGVKEDIQKNSFEQGEVGIYKMNRIMTTILIHEFG